jgi:hypothetical protein
MRELRVNLLLIFQILGERAGDRASSVLDSDGFATYGLAITWLVAGALLGYAIARNVI